MTALAQQLQGVLASSEGTAGPPPAAPASTAGTAHTAMHVQLAQPRAQVASEVQHAQHALAPAQWRAQRSAGASPLQLTPQGSASALYSGAASGVLPGGAMRQPPAVDMRTCALSSACVELLARALC